MMHEVEHLAQKGLLSEAALLKNRPGGYGETLPILARDVLGGDDHHRDVLPFGMAAELGDELETMVADNLWPLPTYREMLFIK